MLLQVWELFLVLVALHAFATVISSELCAVSSLLKGTDNTLPYPDIYVPNEYFKSNVKLTSYPCKSFLDKGEHIYFEGSNQTLKNSHKCIGEFLLIIALFNLSL